MILVPYKLDVGLYNIPYLTVLVCLICLVVFLSQKESEVNFQRSLKSYCEVNVNGDLRTIVDHVEMDHVNGCASVFMTIRMSDRRDATLSEIASGVRGIDFYPNRIDDLKYKQDTLKNGFGHFQDVVPNPLTNRLAYRSDRYDFTTMITSTFAHASWSHLLGNLFFFFVFGSCVECLVGSLHFSVCFVVMAVTTSLAFSYSIATGDAIPTIGLSGVAMGMMALLTTLLPQAKIWCFFWFLLYVRKFTLPIMAIALWYICWNIYDLRSDHSSHINYMAHVSGAVTGVLLGIGYRLFASRRLQEAMVEARA